MPGGYTRSKMRAEQAALAAARSGFPVVIANPTMPIGPHHGNLTPPALMLQHFARRRMQIYLDFVLNLVDVRARRRGPLQETIEGIPGGSRRSPAGWRAAPLGQPIQEASGS